MYINIERFEWDETKAALNAKKHGITFFQATTAFDDPESIFLEDISHSIYEKRHWLIGESEVGILKVVFTYRFEGTVRRIISARRANRRERAFYEQQRSIF
jgi:uncharacterized DUF497 family protein